VIGFGQLPAAGIPRVVDVLAASSDELQTLQTAAAANPHAATVLMQVLRHNETASVADGLLAESLAYSTLQHGREFQRWLQARPAASLPELSSQPSAADLVLLQREDHRLTLTLNRPEKHNAYSAAMRDALVEALQLPLVDATLRQVVVRGAGASFCAGGDLDEFGQARDAVEAHLSRTARSAGALLHRLASRTICELHGACIGAGVELPAFAGRIVAREDGFFQLPEVSMGLIPGAGGTVSILQRIGRHRAAFMALSGLRIDVATAASWGLIDQTVG
jgi:enoyl-CoA hydratase/carnithine racemase